MKEKSKAYEPEQKRTIQNNVDPGGLFGTYFTHSMLIASVYP